MHSVSRAECKRNTLALARTAAATGIPSLLTSSMEEHAQGPLFPDFEEILPEAFERRIKRAGIVDAFDDPQFNAAVEATRRKKLIMCA